jgi:hypothetical protein
VTEQCSVTITAKKIMSETPSKLKNPHISGFSLKIFYLKIPVNIFAMTYIDY